MATVLAIGAAVPAAGANAATPSEAATAAIDAFIAAHPTDFGGLDKLVFRLRGEHITVSVSGVKGTLTGDEADAAWSARNSAVMPMSGTIPAPSYYQTIVPYATGDLLLTGGWDFPDTWAGQGAPVDIAAINISTDPCTRTQSSAVHTYRTYPTRAETFLGTLRYHDPNRAVYWNIADYVTNFTDQADYGYVSVHLVKSATCTGTLNIGAAFHYEGNRGGGIGSLSFQLFDFGVSYSPNPDVEGHWGTDPVWRYF